MAHPSTNNPDNHPNSQSEDNKPETSSVNETKRWSLIIKILLVVIAVALVGGLIALHQHTQNSHPNIADHKEVNLSPEERQRLEAELAGLMVQATDNLPAVQDRYNVYFQIADVKYRLGLYKEALEALDKIAGENQDKAAMWSLYAHIYKDAGDMTAAKDSAKRAVDLDNTSVRNWLDYIELSRADNNVDTTNALYRQALDKTANNIGIITAFAVFLEQAGDKRGAIEQWQKAIEVFPQGKVEYESQIARLQTATTQ